MRNFYFQVIVCVTKFGNQALALIFILLCSVANAQFISIREGGAPVMDGTVGAGEWNDADSLLISITAGSDVTVKYKHDSGNFYFAFLNHLESYNIRFPEVLLDINNDKSTSWLNDDWWFHVSATDCESNTAANDYSNCQLVQPGWTGINNFSPGLPYTDTVEIQIPFSKVNFTSTMTDTIGLGFDVTNTATVWNFWPATGVNIQSPATWGNAIVEFLATGLQEMKTFQTGLTIFPNPAGDKINLIYPREPSSHFLVELRNTIGQALELKTVRWNSGAGTIEAELPDMPPGIYIIIVSDGNQQLTKRFCKI